MPDRLQQEEDAMQAAGIGYRRHEPAFEAGVAQYTVTVPSLDGPVEMVATFPDGYPYFKPYVTACRLGLPHHWNPRSGEVCLLGSGAWHPASDRLARLLQEQWPRVLEANSGDGRTSSGELLEEDQAEPISTYADFEPGTQLVLVNEPDVGTDFTGGATRIAMAYEDPLRGYILGLQMADGSVTASGDRLYAGNLPVLEGRWVRLAEPPPNLSAKGFWLAALAAEPRLKKDLGWAPSGKTPVRGPAAALGPQVQVILVGFPEEVARRQVGIGWVALVRRRASRRKAPSYAQLARVVRAGRTDLFRRAPELTGLANKRVLIAGAGGLGSALAIELGRLPLRGLSIADGDVVDAATSVRFPSAFRFGGTLKVQALQQLISEHQPFTEVSVLPMRVGQPRPGLDGEDQHAELSKTVRETDLVIDATADVDVQYYLSKLCRDENVAYLQAEATPGVWGGLVALYRPGDAWCWVCVQHYLDDEEDDTVPAPPKADAPDVQPPGCAAPTYTGAGFDLAAIATHVVRMAAAHLTGEAGYGRFQDSVFTLRLRDDGGAPVPAMWTAHKVSRHPACRNH